MSKKRKEVKNKKLQVVYIPVTDLKPAEYNPRKWDAAATDHLTESIKRFGLVDPIICNDAPGRMNVVIGGHFRLKIAMDLGITTVPVVYVRIPSIEKESELNLRLNRNTGAWDLELLKKFDVDLLLDVGFNDSDLSDIWDDVLQTEEDDFDVDEAVAAIKKPKTKPGDIYRLGSHILACGDSTDLIFIKKVMGQLQAQMVYCDGPYNIGLSYSNGLTTKGKYQGKQTKDNKSDKEYGAFLKLTIENALAVSNSDTHVFYWCDEKYIGLIQSLYHELGLTNRRVCLWLKNNFNMTPHVAFNKVYEPCVYATRGKPYLAPTLTNLNEVMNKEVSTGNRLTDDVLDLLNIWLVNRVAAQEYEHPTEKPPTLHEKALRRCTKPGDVVLDLFGGSGSTLIACEQMKRRCVTVELEPVFCDVIIKRFETLTKTHAKKIN